MRKRPRFPRGTRRKAASAWQFALVAVAALLSMVALPSNIALAQADAATAASSDGADALDYYLSSYNDTRRGWLRAKSPPGAAEIARYPELFLEGNWHVEWRGHPDFVSADIWIVNGWMLGAPCSLAGHYASCRDPEAAPSLRSDGATTRGENGGGPLVNHAFQVRSLPGGGFEVLHDGAVSGRIISQLQRQAGEAEVLVGTWRNHDGDHGMEIWRREPRPAVSRVECSYGEQRSVATVSQPCRVDVPSYPGNGAMRGNLPSFHVDVFGNGMRGAGPLPVFLDFEESGLEINGYCYLYEKPFAEGQSHGCASWGEPSRQYGAIIGVRISINVIYGATPGVRTVWLGGVPVDFRLVLPPLPETLQPETAVDVGVAPLGTLPDLKQVPVVVSNDGDFDATRLRITLSSNQPFCPFQHGCKGKTQGLLAQIPLCPFGEGEESPGCTACTLQPVAATGPPWVAAYDCPESRLRPADRAKTTIVVDPKYGGGTGAPPNPETCYDWPIVTVNVKAAEPDPNAANNSTDIYIGGTPPVIESLRFMMIGEQDWSSDALTPVTSVFPGQAFVVEATLKYPICGWDLKGRTYSGVLPILAATAESNRLRVRTPLQLKSTKGKLDGYLFAVPRGAKLLRSGPITVEDIADVSRVILEPGDRFVASAQARAAQATLGRFDDSADLRLTALDAFERPTSDRRITPDAPFRAELSFKDGRGPVPSEPILEVDLTVIGGRDTVSGTSPLKLRRTGAGRYVSAPTYGYDAAGTTRRKAGEKLTASSLYAKPAPDGRDSLEVVESRIGFSKITFAREGIDADAGVGDIIVGQPIFVHVSFIDRSRHPEPPAGSRSDFPEKLTVQIIRKPRDTATTDAPITLPASYGVRDTLGRPESGQTGSFALGPGGLFPAIRGGDQIRAYLPGLDLMSPWHTVKHPFGQPRAIQILVQSETAGSATADLQLGATFHVRLAFDQGRQPQVPSLPVKLSRHSKSGPPEEQQIVLKAAATAPHVFVSKTLVAKPDLFPGGLAPGDVIEASYKRTAADLQADRGGPAVSNRLPVVAPPVKVSRITLAAGATPDGGTVGAVASDGSFQTKVSFESPPYDGPGTIDLRVVRNGKAIAEFKSDLRWASPDWEQTAEAAVISLASDRRLGDVAVGDRIEARYGDGTWAPTSSAALTVVGAPGKIEALRFLVAGQPAETLPVGAPVVVEALYEAPPKARPTGVALETGADFAAPDYHMNQPQRLVSGLFPVDGELRRFRTGKILLAGGQHADAAATHLNVLPGYRLEATLGEVQSAAAVVAGAAGAGEATVTVAAVSGFGHATNVRGVARAGDEELRFVTNRAFNLPAGSHRLTAGFPLFFQTDISVKAGETRIVEIPRADLGSLRIDLRDGAGKRQTPRKVDLTRQGPALAGWSNSGFVTGRSDMDLPRGRYAVSVAAPNGQKLDVKGPVVVNGGQVTRIAVGEGRGQLELTVRDADGRALGVPFTVAGVSAIASGDPVDLPPGQYEAVLRDDYASSDRLIDATISAVVIDAGQLRVEFFDLGRIKTDAFDGEGKPAPGMAVTVMKLDGSKMVKTWQSRSGSVDVAPGTYRVVFDDAGEAHEVTVSAAETVTVRQATRLGELVITPGRGLLVVEGFKSAYRYRVVGKQGRVFTARPTRDFARYPLQVPEGIYAVQAVAPSGLVFSARATVAAGKKTSVTLDDYGHLHLIDKYTGDGKDAMQLQVKVPGGRYMHLTNLSRLPADIQTFVLLPPGSYDLRLASVTGPLWEKSIMIAKNTTTDIDLPR